MACGVLVKIIDYGPKIFGLRKQQQKGRVLIPRLRYDIPMDDTRVTVVVRCKPFTSRERISEGEEGVCCVQMLGTKTIVTTPGTQNSQMPLTRTFNFDQSLWSHDIEDANFVHQQEVFNRIGQGVVESGMSGYNTTIFAYGQTVSVPEYTNELFML